MIKFNLLHPSELHTLKAWSFEDEPVIKIGRSSDNHIILTSALISRYHVGIFRKNSDWELINLGANGTYCQGKFITKTSVIDGMIICLCGSGPKIQIYLGEFDTEVLEKTFSIGQTSTRISADKLYSTFIHY